MIEEEHRSGGSVGDTDRVPLIVLVNWEENVEQMQSRNEYY